MSRRPSPTANGRHPGESPLAEVQAAFAAGFTVVPLIRELPADTYTPVSAFLRIATSDAPAFLLESVEGGERTARYSFLGVRPFETLVVRDGTLHIERPGEKPLIVAGPPIAALAGYLARYKAQDAPGLPRFIGGAIGSIRYEMIHHIEPSVPAKPLADGTQATLMLYRSVIAFDHVKHRMLLIANVIADAAGTKPAAIKAAHTRAIADLDALESALQEPLVDPLAHAHAAHPGATNGHARDLKITQGLGEDAYKAGVARLKKHIAAGDIFQAVLADQFRVPITADPFTIYRALRRINPSPYMFYVGLGDETAVGASPEMLVRVENGIVETRPIAGTRPRGRTDEEDEQHERNLLDSVKERAEHVMLVDLGRNDIGRVAQPGTVSVPSFMQIERYSHVMHIVSSVRGKLRRGLSPFDALAACFPAGTVSGAPKIRAMQLIGEIEPVPRGLYSGAVVYADFRGNLDSAIAIRSLSIREESGERAAYVQAGAGVVYDSRPAAEYAEVQNKARAMLDALRAVESEAAANPARQAAKKAASQRGSR